MTTPVSNQSVGLPTELVLRIFTECDKPQDLLNCALTCKTMRDFLIPTLYRRIQPKSPVDMEKIIQGLKICVEKYGKPRPRIVNLSQLGHTHRVGRGVSALLQLTNLEAVKVLKMPFVNHIALSENAFETLNIGLASGWTIPLQDTPEDFYASDEFYSPPLELEVLKRCTDHAIRELRLTSHREYPDTLTLDHVSVDQFAPNLKILVLAGYQSTIPNRTLAQSLGRLANLQYLELCEFSNVNERDLFSLGAEDIPFRLKGLRLGPLAHFSVASLTSILQRHGPTLKQLYLCEDSNDCSEILPFIQNCPVLERVALFIPYLSREALYGFVVGLRNVTHFVIADQETMDSEMIVTLVQNNPKLQALSVPFSDINDERLLSSLAILGENLLLLDVEGCRRLTPNFLASLPEICPNLEVLDISHLDWIGLEPELPLAKVLVHCKKLREVGFANTRFSPAMRESLMIRFGPAGGLIWRGWKCKRFLELAKTDFSVAT